MRIQARILAGREALAIDTPCSRGSRRSVGGAPRELRVGVVAEEEEGATRGTHPARSGGQILKLNIPATVVIVLVYVRSMSSATLLLQ